MTTVEIFYGNRWWARAHIAGCRDIAREARDGIGSGILEAEVSSLEELVNEAVYGAIPEASRPWTEVQDWVSVAPCLKLEGES